MKSVLLASAALVCFSAVPVVAQSEPDGDTQQALGIDAITVYATRQPLPAFDFPGQVSVVDRAEIEDFNPSNLSDVFQAIPGAAFGGGPRRSGEVPNIRGLSEEGVLVLLDGARQSFLSGHDGRFFLDPELVRSIEVLRGPSSALYGSGALGGVIAVETVTAEDLLGDGETSAISVSGGFQSVDDEWRASVTGATLAADGLFDVVGHVTYRSSGDIRLGSGLDLPSEDDVASTLLKASLRPLDGLESSFSWLGTRGDGIDPNNPQNANIAGPGNDLVDRDTTGDTFILRNTYGPEGSDLIDLSVVAYRSVTEVEEDIIASPRLISRKVRTTGVSIDNRSRFQAAENAVLTFTYGGEFYADSQTGSDNTSPDGTRGGVPDAKTRFYGVFAQADLAMDRPLGLPGVFTVIPGARWDRFESEATGEPDLDDESLSPKVGASYRPVEEVLVFGNWAQGFRAPSFNEIYADGVHFQIPDFSAFPPGFVTNFFVSNDDLQPEEAESWEVGAGLDLADVLFAGDALQLKGSYYEASVTNLIDLEVNIPAGCFGAPFPPCGSGAPFGNISRNVNVTNAELDGFELEADYDSDVAYLRANFSAINGIDRNSGDFVGSLSPNLFFADGGVKLPRWDLRVGARLTIASRFDEVNDPTLERDSYAKGDIYAVWQPRMGALDGLRVDLGIDNVTDADYEVVAAGVSQPGRNVKVAVRWRGAF